MVKPGGGKRILGLWNRTIGIFGRVNCEPGKHYQLACMEYFKSLHVGHDGEGARYLGLSRTSPPVPGAAPRSSGFSVEPLGLLGSQFHASQTSWIAPRFYGGSCAHVGVATRSCAGTGT